MKKIQFVDAVFENGEYIRVPIEKIISIHVNQVKVKCLKSENQTDLRLYYTEALTFVIDESFNSTEGLYAVDLQIEEHPIKRVMRFNDIVGIDITTEDGMNYTVYGSWLDDENELNNLNQTATYSEKGDCIISIKNKEIEIDEETVIDVKKETDIFCQSYESAKKSL